LLAYDTERLSFDEIAVESDLDCPVCGEDGIDSVADAAYTERCGIETAPERTSS